MLTRKSLTASNEIYSNTQKTIRSLSLRYMIDKLAFYIRSLKGFPTASNENTAKRSI